jgi:hypothetical protein
MIDFCVPISSEIQAKRRGRPLLLFLDYDGTLVEIAPRPEPDFLGSHVSEAIIAGQFNRYNFPCCNIGLLMVIIFSIILILGSQKICCEIYFLID